MARRTFFTFSPLMASWVRRYRRHRTSGRYLVCPKRLDTIPESVAVTEVLEPRRPHDEPVCSQCHDRLLEQQPIPDEIEGQNRHGESQWMSSSPAP